MMAVPALTVQIVVVEWNRGLVGLGKVVVVVLYREMLARPNMTSSEILNMHVPLQNLLYTVIHDNLSLETILYIIRGGEAEDHTC
jgi:hypothetical protein